MYKLFESKSIFAYFFFFIIILFIGIKVFFVGTLVTENGGSFLLNKFFKVGSGNSYVLKGAVLLSILICFYLTSLLYRHFSYHNKAGLVFQFVFAVNTSLALMFPFSLENILVAFLFLVLSIFLVKTDQMKETVSIFFNIGFVFALSLLISSSMIFYALPMIFALFIYGKSGIKDMLALFLGILSPIVILFSLLFILGLETNFINGITSFLVVKYDLLASWEWLLFGVAFLSALLTFPIINLFTINTRKFYTYLFFCFISILSIFLLLSVSGDKVYFIVMVMGSFYILPFLFEIRSHRSRSFFLFFGLVLAIFATFVRL